MDEWVVIEDFPDYSVSMFGQVCNNRTGRILALARNQHGVAHVGLVRDGEQYKRSVALLVAKAFLPPPTPDTFNTPINLDGDRTNCSVDNLMWRPRWFAILYHRQFKQYDKRRRHYKIPSFDTPIMETHTKEKFANSLEAAMKYGLLDRDIFVATLNRTYVWPTYQRFVVLEE